MKNDCDTSRSTGAVPKQATTAATTTSPVTTSTTPTSTTRSAASRAHNSSLIKQQLEQQGDRDVKLTTPLQRGTCKALFVSN